MDVYVKAAEGWPRTKAQFALTCMDPWTMPNLLHQITCEYQSLDSWNNHFFITAHTETPPKHVQASSGDTSQTTMHSSFQSKNNLQQNTFCGHAVFRKARKHFFRGPSVQKVLLKSGRTKRYDDLVRTKYLLAFVHNDIRADSLKCSIKQSSLAASALNAICT